MLYVRVYWNDLWQDMIENVLEIKDTHVRVVMTPLVNVIAIDVSATLVDLHNSWIDHQYSRYCFPFLLVFHAKIHLIKHALAFRVPVFEERIDNIVGIAYAMDLLDYVQKVNSFLMHIYLIRMCVSFIFSHSPLNSRSMENDILFGFEGGTSGKFSRGRHST